MMRSGLPWGVVLVTAVLLAITCEVSPSSGGSSQRAASSDQSPPTSWADPRGDSGGAPDIASVAVSNDQFGLVTFAISVGNRSALQCPKSGPYLNERIVLSI